jgi:hypothetical protein
MRLQVLAATVLTVLVLWLLLLFKPGAHVRSFPEPAARRPCPTGQSTGCVGGQADVLLLPATPTRPAAPPLPSEAASRPGPT